MKKLKFIFYSILLTIILIGCESKPEETNTTTDTIKVEKSSTVIKDSISTTIQSLNKLKQQKTTWYKNQVVFFII